MLDSFSQLAFPVQALIATLFTWALTSLGACVVFFMRQPNRNVMDAMLGLAGGGDGGRGPFGPCSPPPLICPLPWG